MTIAANTMKVMEVREAGGPFILAEREIPEPGPGQVRVKVAACGICHSDAFVKFGGFPGLTLPRVPGHEVAGVVDAVGEGVTAWKPGERVGVGWHGGHCFQCKACRRGLFINCPNGKVTGVSFDGGYGEYMVAPWEALARMPDGLEFVDAGPLLCAGITTYNSLRNSGARPGDTVAIQITDGGTTQRAHVAPAKPGGPGQRLEQGDEGQGDGGADSGGNDHKPDRPKADCPEGFNHDRDDQCRQDAELVGADQSDRPRLDR